MIEKVYQMTDTQTVEKVIAEEPLQLMHMRLQPGEALPPHRANAALTMVVLAGTLSLQLGDQPVHSYPERTVLQIPYLSEMDVRNQQQYLLELLVIKTPPPVG